MSRRAAGGWWTGGRRTARSWLTFRLTFLTKYSTCVLQISHMVSSGSLLSCDAMFVSVGSQLFGENAFFEDRYFFIFIFSLISLYIP